MQITILETTTMKLIPKERYFLGIILTKLMQEEGSVRKIKIELTLPEQIELPALLAKVLAKNEDPDFKPEFLMEKEYSHALERTRADLWSVNQELREKIESLEKGQEDLLVILSSLRSVPPDQL